MRITARFAAYLVLILAGIVTASLLTACAGQPPATVLPPTQQATPIPPTKTPVPTATRTPTPAPTATMTVTATASPTPTATFTPTPRPELFINFLMLNEKIGFAQPANFSGKLLRTTDGGRTWQVNVLPSNGLVTFFWLDDKTGWVKFHGPYQPVPDQPASFYKTTDGGETWQVLPDLPTPYATLFVFDPQRMVMVTTPGEPYMMGQNRFTIYQTLDGGQNWLKSFDNVGTDDQNARGPTHGYIVFKDMSNGWALDATWGFGEAASAKPGSEYPLRTWDGGRSWAHQKFPSPEMPEGYNVYPTSLKFFDTQRGVMLVQILDMEKINTRWLRLYNTRDGGDTWQISEAVQMEPGTDIATQFFSADHLIVRENGQSHETQDGGKTWTTYPDPQTAYAFPGKVSQVQFLNPQLGYALVNNGGLNDLPTDLYQTVDGGKTWETVEVTVEK